MKISNKIFFSYLTICFLFLAFFISNSFFLSAITDKASGVIPLSEKRLVLREQINQISSLESDVDSYIVIGSEELKAAIKEFPEKSSRIIDILIDTDSEKEEGKKVFSGLSENIDLLIGINEQAENKFALNNQILRVYKSIDELKEYENKLLDNKTKELNNIILEQNNTVSKMTKLLLLISVIILVIGFFLFIVLKNVTKSIAKLQNAVNNIGKGDVDIKIEAAENDEIGELTEAFGRMASDLKKSKKEFRLYAANLEKTVAERIKDIETKKKELEQINSFMVGRELRMMELKKEIKELKNKLKSSCIRP